MFNLINSALAEEALDIAAKQPSPWTSMVPLVLIMVVFYFLLIRPQQKKMKEHQLMVKAIGSGDEVVTSGGIFGKVIKVEDSAGVINLQIADNVQIRVRQDMVSEIMKSTSAKAVVSGKATVPAKTIDTAKQKGKNKKK